MIDTATPQISRTATRGRVARWVLIAWTLGIWGSRVRNILVDDDLSSSDRVLSLAVAVVLLLVALTLAAFMLWIPALQGTALGVLVVLGVLRWTIRAPLILLSDEWETSFKVVHSILWLVTVALSVFAWREFRRSSALEPG